MKITIKQLKKTFDVKSSNKNMRKVYALQLEMNKVATADDDPMAQMQAQLDSMDAVLNFLREVLKLNKKDSEALEDMEMDDTVEMSQYVSMKLLGLSDKDIEDAFSEDEQEEEKN